MKRLLLNLFLLLLIIGSFTQDAWAKNSKKEAQLAQEKIELDKIKVFYPGQRPKRAYEVLSPLSDTSKTEQKSFVYMKKAALEVNADAIIDFNCTTEKRLKLNWSMGQQSFANCKGMAIKWSK